MANDLPSNETLKTPLHRWHVDHGGSMVDFAGWQMPIKYDSIVAEHTATRNAVGLFDVSHMGRFCFSGPAAATFLDGILTRRVTDLKPGHTRYSLVPTPDGGVLDDVLVSHVVVEDTAYFWLVVNASNREKLLAWIEPRIGKYDLTFADETLSTAMFAVQGPRAMDVVDQFFETMKPSEMAYYTNATAVLSGNIPVTISRTGYTGEDGVEFVLPFENSPALWQRLMDAAEPLGGRPIGLGARDTLRLEAGMPLYGHELSEQINPYQAGLGFAVNLKDREFIGREALQDAKENADQVRRIGLQLSGKRVPREGFTIVANGQPVGRVTSGTFSPTLQRPIAMGYVVPEVADQQTLMVDIRGKIAEAEVVPLPFYKRPR